uniref:E3 ubiquitin-protein ligase UHRF n=1 Tax=Sander lucioperca TaxID=283035 RepID=A0A8C9ZDP3_SANLU
MWIQVRTIDGKETRTVEDLSRLTKIESLRLKIQDIFSVSPQQQRLFYRGKQMEDGQTLFDYNVGLNDIVQLLIRSQTDPPDSHPDTSATSNSSSTKNGFKSSSPARDTQPPTSSRNTLVNPGIGVYKINELVDCRDVSIGAWFEACLENVTRAPKGQITPTKGKVGRPPKRTNGKLEAEQGQAYGQGQTTDSNRNNVVLGSESNGASTSQTDSTAATETKEREEDVIYHIKYDDYPENGVVEMRPVDVRPRARTLLRWDQLQVGMHVMVNYNMETPDERGFWFDAEVQTLNQASRTNKELRVKILLGGPGDIIGDCKVHFLDEIYQVEKPGARALSASDGQFKRKSGPECKHCKADPEAECRFCSCCVCGGKQDAHMQLLCDECNMAFHIYCLNPPLATIPDDEDWYCPTCKNDTSEVVKAGEKLKTSKKKAKMPSATTESQRDWGKGMACVGRTKECTIVPSNHYGPIPGIPVGATWKFRVQVSEAGVHRPHVGGIHGRSNDGSYSLVLAGGFEDEVDRGDEFTYTGSGGRDLSGNKRIGEHSFDQTLTHMNRALALNCDAPLNDKDGAESRNWRAGKPVRVVRSSKGRRISKYAPEEGNRYDGIYKVVKYWPEIGKCGYLVWRYLLRRDDLEPAPWTPEGLERIEKLGLAVQVCVCRPKCKCSFTCIVFYSPRVAAFFSLNSVSLPETPPAAEPPSKRVKIEETFQLSQQQQQLIREDTANKKLWDEAMGHLKEGPNFLRKMEQIFMCVCCQELAYQPITTVCSHNVCKTCLQRSFRADVYTCPACRHDLGKDYIMTQNVTLQVLLDQFYPGYSKGR